MLNFINLLLKERHHDVPPNICIRRRAVGNLRIIYRVQIQVLSLFLAVIKAGIIVPTLIIISSFRGGVSKICRWRGYLLHRDGFLSTIRVCRNDCAGEG